MAGDTSDEFQKELVDLFVQEAQEWLQNIHVALDELQQGPPPDRRHSLISTITGGVTNLAGSAATINLPEVEQASLAVLPLVDAVKDPQKAMAVQDFLALCKQLGQIHQALTRATGVTFDAEAAAEVFVQVTVSPAEFLEALRGLQQSRPSGGPADRNLFKTMMDQMEAQIQAGVQQVGVDAIRAYLERMADRETAFVGAMDQSLPDLAAKLSSLAQSGTPPPTVLESSLDAVTKLRTDAQEVNAVPAVTFLTGLHSLLSVMLHHRIKLAAERMEAISVRLGAIRDLVHQWEEQGQQERVAIGRALPAN